MSTETKDAFARSSVARVWQEARNAQEEIDRILGRLEQIESKFRRIRRVGNCVYCGELCHGPVCRSHADLLVIDDLAPEMP